MKKIDIVSSLHLLLAKSAEKTQAGVSYPHLTITSEVVYSISEVNKPVTLYTINITGHTIAKCVNSGMTNYFNVALFIYNYLGKEQALKLLKDLEETPN